MRRDTREPAAPSGARRLSSVRLAYLDGSEAERRELEERHAGPLPSHPDPLAIVAIAMVSLIGPPDDDEDDAERVT